MVDKIWWSTLQCAMKILIHKTVPPTYGLKETFPDSVFVPNCAPKSGTFLSAQLWRLEIQHISQLSFLKVSWEEILRFGGTFPLLQLGIIYLMAIFSMLSVYYVIYIFYGLLLHCINLPSMFLVHWYISQSFPMIPRTTSDILLLNRPESLLPCLVLCVFGEKGWSCPFFSKL